jgi:uncharacterized protein YndB with AHSA1/START domain
MKFANTVTIARSPAEVFAFLAQFENIPRWNYAITETRKLSTGPVGVGSRYVQSRTVPTRGEESFEVTEYSPDRTLSIEGTIGPFGARLTYVLEPVGTATLLTNSVDLEPSGLFRLAAPLAVPRVKTAVADNLGVLKRLLERRDANGDPVS